MVVSLKQRQGDCKGIARSCSCCCCYYLAPSEGWGHGAAHHGTPAKLRRNREGWWPFPHHSKSGHPITTQAATIHEFPSVASYYSLVNPLTANGQIFAHFDACFKKGSPCLIFLVKFSHWGLIGFVRSLTFRNHSNHRYLCIWSFYDKSRRNSNKSSYKKAGDRI